LERSDWTDSNSKKENYDDLEPPNQVPETKISFFCRREAVLCRDDIIRRYREYSKGFVPRNLWIAA